MPIRDVRDLSILDNHRHEVAVLTNEELGLPGVPFQNVWAIWMPKYRSEEPQKDKLILVAVPAWSMIFGGGYLNKLVHMDVDPCESFPFMGVPKEGQFDLAGYRGPWKDLLNRFKSYWKSPDRSEEGVLYVQAPREEARTGDPERR